MKNNESEKYMKMAIELAKKGEGRTNPNPMVGAVIVKNGEVIGMGYHEQYGQAHAERNALYSCNQSPKGADMYVTLEPCCHYGKTPPCTEAIIENKISKVIIGSGDPNQQVAGKGIQTLKAAGIEVVEGVMKKECEDINKIFFYYIKNKKPYIAMKYAMTMDGKIAAYTGESKWITGKTAREHVHKLRHKYMGIMVGIGTVMKDNPMLNCRMEEGRSPSRIICDTTLRIPLDSRIVATAESIDTYIATASEDEERIKLLSSKGCRILRLGKKNGHIDLQELLTILGAQGIDSILLEGGGTLNFQALSEGIVNHVYTYIAPKFLGGKDAVTPVEGLGMKNPDEAFKMINRKITVLGEDILIEHDTE